VRLFEHPDFSQLMIRAASHFRGQGLREALIEKDYYVTEALRSIAAAYPDKIIFKGGTSLSKGWNLIQRFSEDIDIFLDPAAFDPELGRNAIDRELKKLRDIVKAHPGLTLEKDGSNTTGGFGRSDAFNYDQIFSTSGEIASRFLVETGTGSGREPTVTVNLQSYLGRFLQENGTPLGTQDEASFPMKLLHFRRTFVEKMFAIHGKVELFKRNKRPIGSYARHYYDLYQLSSQGEVVKMLRSPEYDSIKSDYDEISKKLFSKNYFYPKDMKFSKSDALFPDSQLSASLSVAYESQCSSLCYRPYPKWVQVLERFEELRDIL